MADEGMSEDQAKALADVVQRATGHDVEVQAEDGFFVVEVRRAIPGDVFTLRDEADWEWLEPQIHAPD